MSIESTKMNEVKLQQVRFTLKQEKLFNDQGVTGSDLLPGAVVKCPLTGELQNQAELTPDEESFGVVHSAMGQGDERRTPGTLPAPAAVLCILHEVFSSPCLYINTCV